MRTISRRLAWLLWTVAIVSATACAQQGVTDPVVLQQPATAG
jgi:hypothetical protein